MRPVQGNRSVAIEVKLSTRRLREQRADKKLIIYSDDIVRMHLIWMQSFLSVQ